MAFLGSYMANIEPKILKMGPIDLTIRLYMITNIVCYENRFGKIAMVWLYLQLSINKGF